MQEKHTMLNPSLLTALKNHVAAADVANSNLAFKQYKLLQAKRFALEFIFILFVQIMCFISFENLPYIYLIATICAIVILFYRSFRAMHALLLGTMLGALIVGEPIISAFMHAILCVCSAFFILLFVM